MAYKLVVDQPNLGDEGSIYIHGLGTFKNGEYDITDEQEQAFRVANSYSTTHPENPYQSTGTELGPDLQTATRSMYGISIKETTEHQEQDKTVPVDPEAEEPREDGEA